MEVLHLPFIKVCKKIKILRFTLYLDIMVCKKMKVLNSLIIHDYGFLNDKARRWQNYVQDDEVVEFI
jgi:hypothetical protein